VRIGIVGLGIVGSAIKYGFERLNHVVKIHDIKLKTSIKNVLDTEIVYICVPTPCLDTGQCDTTIVEDIIDNLSLLGYNGIVAIKSSVIPGTTQRMIDKYADKLTVCCVPEFLRERASYTDFMEDHDVCIIGTEDNDVFELVKKSHGRYPRKFIKVTPTEAEFCKYFNNIYNACLVVLANSFYEVCRFYGVDYTNVKNAITSRDHICNLYLDCNENIRGFGGSCLPLNCRAMDYVCKSNHINVGFFYDILNENAKHKTTVFDGMRK